MYRYHTALTIANAFDSKLNTDANKISADYAAVCALSVRQALAVTELTISKTSSGAWNTTDLIVFMKGVLSFDGTMMTIFIHITTEISSDGVRQIRMH